MAEQAEAGDIGGRVGAVAGENARADAVRVHHVLDRTGDPARLGLAAHVGGEQRTGADRLGHDQRVARFQSALAQHGVARNQSVDREPEREFRAFARVPADERAVGITQHLVGAGHHLRQIGLDLGLDAVGHGGDRERRLRLGAHREDVAQGVVRGDLAEQVGVIDDGAEVVDAVHCEARPTGFDHGSIIGRIEPDQHVVAVGRHNLAERAREHGRADLGAAPAAPHRHGGDFLERGRIRHLDAGHRRRRRHLRKRVELRHETAVDPVLPTPDPGAFEGDAIARADRMAVARGDQIHRITLRFEGDQRAAFERPANIAGQRLAAAHGIDPRLGHIVTGHRRHIAGGEHVAV